MSIIKLKPNTKDYIWGGEYFKTYKKGLDKKRVAECWELSLNKDNECFEYFSNEKITNIISSESIGPACQKFPFFPVLVKLIDAKENLSVQVHPSDEYALKNENQFGKEEMWHILSCDKDSGIYVGFNKDYQPQEIYNSLKDGTILSKLNFFKVKPNDTFLIKPGTVHAIGKGVRLIEIQQNSTLTYRLYDYLRKDACGNYRELHIDKAMKILNFSKYIKEDNITNCLAKTRYFIVNKVQVINNMEIFSGKNSFKTITFISGSGTINNIPYDAFDTFYIPYKETAIIKGNGVFIETFVD